MAPGLSLAEEAGWFTLFFVPTAPDIKTGDYGEGTTVSTPLRVYRVARGLTQAQLAARAGVARITVGALERREATPQLHTAQVLASALGVPTEELFPPEDDFGSAANGAEVKTPAEAGRHAAG